MDAMNMGDALKRFINESPYKHQMQAAQIESAWENIMGKTIANYTDKIQIIGDKLIISTQVAPLKQELNMQSEKILKRVNEELGREVVKVLLIQ